MIAIKRAIMAIGIFCVFSLSLVSHVYANEQKSSLSYVEIMPFWLHTSTINANLYPGINIASAIVSPITDEILFLDLQDNIIVSPSAEDMSLALTLINNEDMEIIEYLMELSHIEYTGSHPVVTDTYGNLFFVVPLDNGIALNSARFEISGVVRYVNDVNNSNNIYAIFFAIFTIIVIIVFLTLKFRRKV